MPVRDVPLILACSPRKGGNCDTAATRVRHSLHVPGGKILYLRDFSILPCVSCGYCAKNPGGPCPLQKKDDSAQLFKNLESTSTLVLVAPIYFYHVPAQLKALIDRSQPWWTENEAGNEPALGRSAHVVLIGARKTGQRLFEGALLTMRCWLGLFGYALSPPLTLYGLDAPGDLARDEDTLDRVVEYAGRIGAKPLPSPDV